MIFSFSNPVVDYRSPVRANFDSDDSEVESPERRRIHAMSRRTNPATTFTMATPTSSNPPAPPPTSQPNQHNEMAIDAEAQELAAHLALLKTAASHQDHHELSGTPIVSMPVLKQARHLFSQYGFFAGLSDVLESDATGEDVTQLPGTSTDPRLFFNISAPSSAFICGSQGSGKSHTLSCLLENCLMKSNVSKLENPLAGLVFHYDSFTSDLKGAPCEAAYLSSNPNIKVRVLCSPTNLQTIKRTYLGMNVDIEPLRINQSDLTTKRMLDLMAVSQDDGPMPLYLHAINRILRDMRMVQQQTNRSFNYAEFKRLVADTNMTPGQLAPLTQRLDTLESFMPKSQTESDVRDKSKKNQMDVGGNDWTIKPGSLTIVDLSCPCVTAEGACALFNMCLSLFLEQKTSVGRVIALDEAHKYMNSASEATALTNTLLSSIRLQRHLGARVFISTQEPTISPKLLDLCSFTIVHRFSSPDWLRCLKSHLAALDIEEDSTQSQKSKMINIFNQIVKLRVGEALLFAPSATVGIGSQHVEASEPSSLIQPQMERLGLGYLKIKIRARITTDEGKSVMATSTGIPINLKSGSGSKSDSSSLFGTAPVVMKTSVIEVQAQKAAASSSSFGAPSPTPGIFGSIRATAPSVPAVESLKARGTLGLNHTPPVTRVATSVFNVKLPEASKSASNANIFGSLTNNAVSLTRTQESSTIFGVSKGGEQDSLVANTNVHALASKSLVLREHRKPTTESTRPETANHLSTISSSSLADSVFASPKTKSNQAKTSSSTLKNQIFVPLSSNPHTLAIFCPGTRGFMFTPYSETEIGSSMQMINTFQNLCAKDTFQNFSPEELRLADYATKPKSIKVGSSTSVFGAI